MVINNYTGDRLNFGLAIEMAKNIHKYRSIKTIIVDDDCAIENPRKSTGRRGLTGINLIIKIAGAMSIRGYKLNEIYQQCSSILNNRLIRTIGFTFQHSISELNQIDIGYGIHGEPGALKLDSAKSFKSIIDVLAKKLKLADINSDIVVLFNNLGGASDFIFYHFLQDFIESINDFSLNIINIYSGKFLTSLGKEGIGVSIMEVKDNLITELLEHPIDTPAVQHLFNFLPKCSQNTREIEFQVPSIKDETDEKFSCCVPKNEIELMREVLMKICHDLSDARVDLNQMDKEFADGDTGETFLRGSNAVLDELSRNSLNIGNPQKFLFNVSDTLMKSMGGTSGAIFSIFFQCASNAFTCNDDDEKHKEFRVKNEYSIHNWLQAISNGIDGIMRHTKADIGDRTLLDSLYVGFNEMKMSCNDGNTLEASIKAFSHGCHVGAENTRQMFPKSGRSAYSMADKILDSKFISQFPDAGAHAILIISHAIFTVLQGRI